MATKVGTSSKLDFDCTLFNLMNQDKLDFYFVMYDDLSDELIFKFIEPQNPTSYHYVSPTTAAIVDIVTNQMVGVAICNFKDEVMPNSKWSKVWTSEIELRLKRNYQKIIPTKKQQQIEKLYNAYLETLDRKGPEKVPCL